MRRATEYAPLSVVGLELEYAVVDGDLRPACVVADAFRAAHGRATSDVTCGPVGFSNELAAHVLEIKMVRPHADLARAEAQLSTGVARFARLLRDRFGARLLPTAMHPFMKPADTDLWRRGGRSIYDAYARIFDIRAHGWLNVQSTHVNLPFGRTEADLVLLYNAVACLLPYLPALAASSPLVEGRVGRHLDNRLAYYRTNQSRIPEITGQVVPRFLASVAEYRRDVLEPIYEALRGIRGSAPLRREWVNSRAAILRFERRALEIRVLDVQECVRMDVAIAVFTRAVLRWLMRALRQNEVALPAHAMLVHDLRNTITDGRSARVSATHFSHNGAHSSRCGDVLAWLLERARRESPPKEQAYLELVGRRLTHGSLAELVRHRVRKRASRRSAVRDVYEELIVALESNRPWYG